jgi:hypothetical protein
MCVIGLPTQVPMKRPREGSKPSVMMPVIKPSPGISPVISPITQRSPIAPTTSRPTLFAVSPPGPITPEFS